MKHLLLFVLLCPFFGMSQDASYTINNHFISPNFDFLLHNNKMLLVDFSGEYYYPSISSIPLDGSPGTTKHFGEYPDVGYGYNCAIAKCNLSDNFVAIYYTSTNDACMVFKMDENANIIWSKRIDYPITNTNGDYGSNIKPLALNAQDEILITMTPYSCAILTKLNANGGLIASKKIQSTDNPDGKNPGFSINPTSDLGFLVTMKNGSNPTLIKLNSNFEVVWSKKWLIDGYSHPKTSVELSNGHFLVVGDGDFGTFISEVDENGNLLSYKAGIGMMFPYAVTKLPNDYIEIFDAAGKAYTTNFISSNGVMRVLSENTYGIPKVSNGLRNFFDQGYYRLFLNLDGQEKDCFDVYQQTISLFDVEVEQNQVINESVAVENFGSISNYVPTASVINGIYFAEACEGLGVNQTDIAPLNVYPNPSTVGQSITFDFGGLQASTLDIQNISGQTLETLPCANESQLSTALNYPAGVYFVRLLDAKGALLATTKIMLN